MQQSAGLFSQHVSSIIMPIFRSSILLHLVGYLFYIIDDARSHEHQIVCVCVCARVCVALFIQRAERRRHIFISGLCGSAVFFHVVS
jgi:hypothetical protein